jgi:hypothetical protein
MTADDSTPNEGQDSTDIDRESFPLKEATNEDLALALEDHRQEMRSAVDDVSRALLNESEPLTDEKVDRLWTAADEVAALSRTLVLRVPDAHRFEEVEDGSVHDC